MVYYKTMGTDQIMYCIVALILGMLMYHMLKGVCGCKNVVEGYDADIMTKCDQGDKAIYEALPNTDKPKSPKGLCMESWCNGEGSTQDVSHDCNTCLRELCLFPAASCESINDQDSCIGPPKNRLCAWEANQCVPMPCEGIQDESSCIGAPENRVDCQWDGKQCGSVTTAAEVLARDAAVT